MNNLWNYTLLNNSLKNWTIAIIIAIVSISVLRLLQYLFITKLKSFANRTTTKLDDIIIDVIRTSIMPILYILAVHFSFQYLNLPQKFLAGEHAALMVVVTFFTVKMIILLLRYSFNQALLKSDKNEQREKQLKGILLIIQIVLWIAGLLFLIDNLGYDITTLIAGLGIGGIAIALAAQTILGDLFSYLVIFFDKPFEIGDFIIIDDKMGTVEYIGIKTTRLRTLGGEQLVCSNTDLTNSRVHNYKRMQERRVAFEFGIVYNIPPAKLKIIPQMVKRIVESLEDTRFDRAHFKSFGDFSLNFEVVFYVLSSDYNKYMDIQQEINLRLFEVFEKEEIEFAFPTQTVLLNKISQEENYRA